MEGKADTPPPKMSPGEKTHWTILGALSTGLTLVDLGLLYGAATHSNWTGVALTAAGGVLGIYNTIRNFLPVDMAYEPPPAPPQEPLKYAPPPPPETRLKPPKRVKMEDDPFKGVGGYDPLDDERPFNPDDFRKGKNKEE